VKERRGKGRKKSDETKHHFLKETEQRPSLGEWTLNECAKKCGFKRRNTASSNHVATGKPEER
jgi:hypothetical protein